MSNNASLKGSRNPWRTYITITLVRKNASPSHSKFHQLQLKYCRRLGLDFLIRPAWLSLSLFPCAGAARCTFLSRWNYHLSSLQKKVVVEAFMMGRPFSSLFLQGLRPLGLRIFWPLWSLPLPPHFPLSRTYKPQTRTAQGKRFTRGTKKMLNLLKAN